MRVPRSARRPAPAILAALGLSLCVACASPVVEYDFDPEADFSGYTTFHWIDPSEVETEPRMAREPLVDARIRRAVNVALTDRGYRKTDTPPWDFLVIYQGALEDKEELIPVYTQTGAVRGMQTYAYKEGTLVLDVYDGASKRLVWRGSVTQAFDDEDRALESIEKLATSLAAKFPPPE
jgi:hypothetical protein